MANENNLIISETFYSIQGEGPHAGRPAVFLRLAGCNLRCNGFSYYDPDTKEHLGCDTKAVWRRGTKYNIEQLLVDWHQKNYIGYLKAGAHLVLTGGEPTLQQKQLIAFIQKLDAFIEINQFDFAQRGNFFNNKIYIELETNATQLLQPVFFDRVDQINASPKLSNSKEPKHKAYNAKVLGALAKCNKTKFKFVVKEEHDIKEIIQSYVEPFTIAHKQIWLMPEGGDCKTVQRNSIKVVELCKHYGMNYSPRLQIFIWNEATGV